MKQKISFFVIFLVIVLTTIPLAALSPPQTRVVLFVNGQKQLPGVENKINVYAGERVRVKAKLEGGMRAVCLSPEQYESKKGKLKVMTKGENGFSFVIDGGFKGRWSLASEKATYEPGKAFQVHPLDDLEAEIEIPSTGYGQAILTVHLTAEWKFKGESPGNKNLANTSTDKATGTFYFNIEHKKGVWYSSANLEAEGIENQSVRNKLTDIQSRYDLIASQIIEKVRLDAPRETLETVISNNISNLKMQIDALRELIATLKKTDTAYSCSVRLIGLPTDQTIKNLDDFRKGILSLIDVHQKLTSALVDTNEYLKNVHLLLSSNALKSILKNYINWCNSLPTDPLRLVILFYDPMKLLTFGNLAPSVAEWMNAADKDATILQNQTQKITNLTLIKQYLIEEMKRNTEYSKYTQDRIKKLSVIEPMHQSLKSYFAALADSNVRWIPSR